MTQQQEDWVAGAVDAASEEALGNHGLEYRIVASGSPDFDGWLAGVVRGFQDGEPSAAQVAAARERNSERRLTGVFDRDGAQPEVAVGTIASWAGELTVPGGSTSSVAISAVTVAQTHRRRGIARALLEGELRAAAASGIPLASLTVTESTLYGRYGFGAAGSGAIIDIDTRRVRWAGPVPGGRLDYAARDVAQRELVALHERARGGVPGDVSLPPGHEHRFTGTAPDAERGGATRCVQYRDESGEVRGILAYTIALDDRDRIKGTATITALVAETDEAYAALWRFVLELDLVTRVHAELCAVDEPVLWMIGDRRAASVSVFDHQYLRILDLAGALEARRYAAPGRFALEVADRLGIAGGRVMLDVAADGTAAVTRLEPADAVPPGATSVSLDSSVLASLYLGDVSAVALGRAGRVRADDVESLARTFGWPVTPRVAFWY
ncbi:GNAT family N-acetyltransferase [Microbacterium radiodurans]|uniref:GNAT family N-acetyltransferase n=1 Tax=Microbacterium radiodurans TaxID=661398 RepID=A0A5J5IRT4_9MICO|nr:GNAT family N-acetyltransferase [Microbacterium radiodurans]KAA9086588.1 GNAT family N-acetyltransferase [Microbacterium radiodurans]